MKYIITLVSLFFTSMTHNQNLHLDGLNNTKILKNPKKVQAILQQYHFQKNYFKSADGIKLCGLFLDKTKNSPDPIKGTLIYCAGFYPGTKEGMTTFYTMLQDQPYNFLFFDARGHHESEGSLFSYSNLKQYGSSEYQDVVAAIKFVQTYNEQNNLPSDIILHGICAGAFHAVKACDYLTKQNDPAIHTIRGIIFDSGWNSINSVVEPIIAIEVKQRLENSYFSWFIKPLTSILQSLYSFFLKSHHCKVCPLQPCIPSIQCPIFFIHSPSDTHIAIEQIEPLLQVCKKPICWLPEIESHATYHLKQQKEYTTKIIEFLQSL